MSGEKVTRGRIWGVLGLGLALIACGAGALALPNLTNFLVSNVLGATLAIAGIVMIAQAFQADTDTGRIKGIPWQMLAGTAEIVGGVLIFLQPMKGAAIVTLLVAIIIGAQGIALLGLSLKLRPRTGWIGLAVASVGSFLIALAIVARFPFTTIEDAGRIAGVALIIGGLAYTTMGVGLMRLARSGP